jgi:uncharacterized protein YndB with AHSA1/START domain
MAATEKKLSSLTGNELKIERIFDAPRELVWKAWTEPERIMRWWGPKDFTSPSCKIDFRVGGTYLFCMRWPHGSDLWSTGVYLEIVQLEKIVYTDSFADEKGNVVPATYYGFSGDFPMENQVTLIFEDIDGKTKLTLIHEGLPAGEHRNNASIGWNQSLDKLAESIK